MSVADDDPRTAERGTGATTRQMREAPQGAVYVWCNGHTHYPRALAQALGRQDLRILTPGAVATGALMGGRLPIVVDHAFWELASERQTDEMRRALAAQDNRRSKA